MEQTIIQSKRYDLVKIVLGALVAAAAIAIFVLFCISGEGMVSYMEGMDYTFFEAFAIFANQYGWISGIVFGGLSLFIAIFYFAMKACEITVTDKRVYGASIFGRRVDLPLDSVSAVATSFPKGIAVATSSGRIKFLLIKNAAEIHGEIRKLLIDRQDKRAAAKASAPQSASEADELKKYKALLEEGVITQEEFDAKKKQLLGL